jgi:hypothetical protein
MASKDQLENSKPQTSKQSLASLSCSSMLTLLGMLTQLGLNLANMQ